MDIFLTAVAVIVIFSVLVLIHEYGHFIAARRAGIKVLEFGIGFPPRIFKKKIGETLYTVNAIPFGGFVKLYGEDSSDPAMIKDPKSFAHKSPWIRTKVVIAGVVMNFILAVFLLTIGFSFGIEPLLVSEQDLMTGIQSGLVKTAPGAYVAKVSDDVKKLGLDKGDRIIAVNDKPVKEEDQLAVFEKGGAVRDIDLTASGLDGGIKRIHVPAMKNNYLGIQLKPYTRFPRMEVLEVKEKSASRAAGVLPGDVVLMMNGEQIYSASDIAGVFEQNTSITIQVLRGDAVKDIAISPPDARKVVLANIFPLSAAERAGFQKGDAILSINGIGIATVQQMQDILRQNPGADLTYSVQRNGKKLYITAKTGDGNILGVELSYIASYKNSEISFFRSSVLTSVTEIGKVKYGPWKAFKESIRESIRLTGLTISAFGKTLSSIVSRFQVPGDVGGPVQIAYYTHAFVQEGFFALLRFMALLSLSLAVINILPIPALDGGRFLFIVIEALFGKRINARAEAVVHGIGFILLMGLILLITYSDIMKLF